MDNLGRFILLLILEYKEGAGRSRKTTTLLILNAHFELHFANYV